MDPTHFDKIADKLIQFRSKIPSEANLELRDAKCAVFELKKQIDDLLWQIDTYSMQDSTGWIR
jgi:hypothetical protein|tara:strand:- start:610 stop:798 length:189 start_codon:yes stop_codon:yes gene_type:complete